MHQPAPDSREPLARAAARLRDASSVVVFTGAGVSVESGLATFRTGSNAMWNDADVSTYPTPRGYRAHIPNSWRWYAMRAHTAAGASPNPGHLAIVAIERRLREFLLVTQNVDGLHHRAGSKNVVELHGNLRQTRCFDCDARSSWPTQPADPRCARCGGLLRPDVVFFEENLPPDALERAHEAVERCDLLISVGTSNLVWPARELPDLAHVAGADVVIVNVDMAGQMRPGDRVTHLSGIAGDILPQLVARAWSATP